MSEYGLSSGGLRASRGSYLFSSNDSIGSKEKKTDEPLSDDEYAVEPVDLQASQLRLSLSGSLSTSYNMLRLSASKEDVFVSIVDDLKLKDKGLVTALSRVLSGVDDADEVAGAVTRNLITWIHDKRPNRSGTSFKAYRIDKYSIEASLELSVEEVAQKIRDLAGDFAISHESLSGFFNVLAVYLVANSDQREALLNCLSGETGDESLSIAEELEFSDEGKNEMNTSFSTANDSHDPIRKEPDDEGGNTRLGRTSGENNEDDDLFFGDLDD